MHLSEEQIKEMSELYKQQIEVPSKELIPSKQFILCPVGLVGSGKTTIVKPLSEKLHMVRISTDEMRKLLKQRLFSYDQLKAMLEPILLEFAQQGHSITIDADCGSPKTKELVEKAAEAFDARVFWIHINPPEEFILNKLRTYKHTWLFDDCEHAVRNYFQQKEKRQQEATHFDYFAEIDTSQENIKEQINGLASRIKDELGI